MNYLGFFASSLFGAKFSQQIFPNYFFFGCKLRILSVVRGLVSKTKFWSGFDYSCNHFACCLLLSFDDSNGFGQAFWGVASQNGLLLEFQIAKKIYTYSPDFWFSLKD